eukprot:CAMPEP_0178866446 /NCGR_PEP_ID=MMETSP0747-20121128/4949_1 /TAXON_ID=913974 /ORGANISM="Nitzschia punctata, Strain CCMP561" /LENGTH=38 /DNA_ID= /DNA_START= /DNA_END= /DNA_ORIENTATION=
MGDAKLIQVMVGISEQEFKLPVAAAWKENTVANAAPSE